MKLKYYRKFIAVVFCALLAFSVVACNGDGDGNTYKVTVTPQTLSVMQYDSVQLTAKADHDGSITWSSSDNTVATVSADGLVTGVKAGTATVSAATDKAKGSCTVTVIASNKVPNFSLSQYDTSLRVGKSVLVGTEVFFNSQSVADQPTVSWASGDDKVATVAGGVITGVGYGDTTVEASCEYNGFKLKKSVSVSVRENVDMMMSQNTADIFSFNPDDSAAYPTTKSLSVSILEEGTEVSDLTGVVWSSSDTSIATVDGSGQITAVQGADGLVEIKASWKNSKNNDYYDLCILNVSRPVVETEEKIYQRYTGLDADKKKIANDGSFSADLSGETLLNKLTLSADNKWVLEMDGVKAGDIDITVSGKTLSADLPENLENGSYELICKEGLDAVISVPLEVYNHIFTDKDDIKQLIHYGDNIETETVGIWPGVFGEETAYTYYGSFALGADIDFGTDVVGNGHPAHSYEGLSNVFGLHGVFDGRGHTLTGGIYGKGGILGFGSNDSMIKNVAVVGATLKSDIMSAVFASSYYGSAENVLVEMTTVQPYLKTDPFHCRGAFGFYIGGTGNFSNCIFYANNPDSFSPLTGGGDAVIGHFSSEMRTYNDCYIFTDYKTGAYFATSSTREGIFYYGYDIGSDTLDMSAFDSDLWDFSSGKARFK